MVIFWWCAATVLAIYFFINLRIIWLICSRNLVALDDFWIKNRVVMALVCMLIFFVVMFLFGSVIRLFDRWRSRYCRQREKPLCIHL